MLMGNFVTVTDRLSALLQEVVNFADGQIKKGHCPFLPFVVSQSDEKNELVVLEEFGGSQIQQRGLRFIGERGPARAILCYSGFLTVGDKRKDAIYAIACEAGSNEASVFARPYRPKAFLHPFVTFENLARYGVVENPLANREPERRPEGERRLFERTFNPVDHPLRPTLDQRYLDMRSAMASGKADPIAAMLAPGFKSINLQGQEQSAYAMIESVLRLKIDRTRRTANTTLVELEQTGGKVSVLQHYSMTIAGDVAPSFPKQLQTLSIDRWTRSGDTWLLEVTQTREVESITGSGEHRYGKATTAPIWVKG
jgi:hypothetical protein